MQAGFPCLRRLLRIGFRTEEAEQNRDRRGREIEGRVARQAAAHPRDPRRRTPAGATRSAFGEGFVGCEDCILPKMIAFLLVPKLRKGLPDTSHNRWCFHASKGLSFLLAGVFTVIHSVCGPTAPSCGGSYLSPTGRLE